MGAAPMALSATFNNTTKELVIPFDSPLIPQVLPNAIWRLRISGKSKNISNAFCNAALASLKGTNGPNDVGVDEVELLVTDPTFKGTNGLLVQPFVIPVTVV